MSEGQSSIPDTPTIEPREGPATDALVGKHNPLSSAPEWVAPMIRMAIWRVAWVAIAVIGTFVLLGRARSLVGMLVISVFLALAMIPAVNHLHHRRGWSRGAATGAVFGIVALFAGIMIFLLIPGLVKAAGQISGQIPQWIDQINRTFNVRIDNGKAPAEINEDIQNAIQTWVQDHAKEVLGLASSAFGLLFQVFTIATFTFYFAAGAPNIAQAYLSRLPPERQQRVGNAWDTAVVQTGGYFYSRSLLLIANATLAFFVMLILGVPWLLALPLAVFMGFASEFIPVIGTYLGAAIPVIVVLGLLGATPAIILIVWVLVYQQLENYVFSPRISAKTMELNGGVAFGAALAGGAIAGPMGAFMALPVAAMITVFIKQYSRKYPVVYKSAYDDPDNDTPLLAPAAPKAASSELPG
jgi:predicted PurR-regulated permease PerM